MFLINLKVVINLESESVTSIRDALESVVGEYVPRTETYEVLGVDDTVHTLTKCSPDYLWFGSVLVLLLSLFCFFRAIGGMLKWKI